MMDDDLPSIKIIAVRDEPDHGGPATVQILLEVVVAAVCPG